jgi:hypothetical protein
MVRAVSEMFDEAVTAIDEPRAHPGLFREGHVLVTEQDDRQAVELVVRREPDLRL